MAYPNTGMATNVIGVAVLALDHTGLAGDTETLAVREVWLPVLERNSQHVNDILADRSDFSSKKQSTITYYMSDVSW